MYITITSTLDLSELFRINQILTLKKDYYNLYDNEAIKVLNEDGISYGYVANSVNTRAKGTHSAGYIYNKFNEKIKCKVKFITQRKIIAEILFKN